MGASRHGEILVGRPALQADFAGGRGYAAAQRLSGSAASAVRAAKRQGDNRRSERIEACRGVILGAIEEKVDLTLTEITEMLRLEHGASFAPRRVRCGVSSIATP
jgi:hypothetical protein